MRGEGDHIPPSNTEVKNKWSHASTSPYPFRSYAEKPLPLPLPYQHCYYSKLQTQNFVLANANLQSILYLCSLLTRTIVHNSLLVGTRFLGARCEGHLQLETHYGFARGAFTVRSWYTHKKPMIPSRYAYGTLTVRPRYTHGTLMVHSRYVHCTTTVSPRHTHGTLMVHSLVRPRHTHCTPTTHSRYAHGTLTVRPRYTHGTVCGHDRQPVWPLPHGEYR